MTAIEYLDKSRQTIVYDKMDQAIEVRPCTGSWVKLEYLDDPINSEVHWTKVTMINEGASSGPGGL